MDFDRETSLRIRAMEMSLAHFAATRTLTIALAAEIYSYLSDGTVTEAAQQAWDRRIALEN